MSIEVQAGAALVPALSIAHRPRPAHRLATVEWWSEKALERVEVLGQVSNSGRACSGHEHSKPGVAALLHSNAGGGRRRAFNQGS